MRRPTEQVRGRNHRMFDAEKIVAEHGRSVWRTVYRLLNHHADACDAYQDVFLSAFDTARKRNVDSWAALLGVLATRRAMDRLRQRYRVESQCATAGGLPE